MLGCIRKRPPVARGLSAAPEGPSGCHSQKARHRLCLDQPKAQFACFGCTEKIEYRAVVWGTIIMGLTGLLIWFKVDVTRFFHTRLSVFLLCAKPDWL